MEADFIIVKGRQHGQERYGKRMSVPSGSKTACMTTKANIRKPGISMTLPAVVRQERGKQSEEERMSPESWKSDMSIVEEKSA